MERLVAEAVSDIVEGAYSLRQLHQAINDELAKVPLFDNVVYNACYGGLNYSDCFLEYRKESKSDCCCIERMEEFGMYMATEAVGELCSFLNLPDTAPDEYHKCENDVYQELSDEHFNPVNYGNTVYVPLVSMYAGDDFVDMVTVSTYNACGTSSVVLRTFTQVLNVWYYQMLDITNRPIGIGEIGTTSYCGVDKPAWLKDAWKQLALKYTSVTSIDWFMENKPFGHTTKDWDTNSNADTSAFASGWNEFKQDTRAPNAQAVNIM
ncbi:hypothetical protein JKP88DRAFT_248322 [Tribonema minus]|uniref:Uncharacterized protein n=1 Tax=Tribonema minus TaxID=303371 RepID=A0A836CA54_9STRA|nr:hypothetical protein JKP88DRAFT_248322 [Tribonema minus]